MYQIFVTRQLLKAMAPWVCLFFSRDAAQIPLSILSSCNSRDYFVCVHEPCVALLLVSAL